jgi:hypothetical protein
MTPKIRPNAELSRRIQEICHNEINRRLHAGQVVDPKVIAAVNANAFKLVDEQRDGTLGYSIIVEETPLAWAPRLSFDAGFWIPDEEDERDAR